MNDQDYTSKPFIDLLEGFENGTNRIYGYIDPLWLQIAILNNKLKAVEILLNHFKVPKTTKVEGKKARVKLELKERIALYQLTNAGKTENESNSSNRSC